MLLMWERYKMLEKESEKFWKNKTNLPAKAAFALLPEFWIKYSRKNFCSLPKHEHKQFDL